MHLASWQLGDVGLATLQTELGEKAKVDLPNLTKQMVFDTLELNNIQHDPIVSPTLISSENDRLDVEV